MEWGMETRLVELFGPSATDIRTRRQTYTFRYRSSEQEVAAGTAHGRFVVRFARAPPAGSRWRGSA
jgi:hypothetical protein